jgi:hypothetical protein
MSGERIGLGWSFRPRRGPVTPSSPSSFRPTADDAPRPAKGRELTAETGTLDGADFDDQVQAMLDGCDGQMILGLEDSESLVFIAYPESPPGIE